MENLPYEQIVMEIGSKIHNELILFFVIVLIIIIPLYHMTLKGRKENLAHENARHDKYLEREKQLINVITANTDAISGLKATLDLSRTSTSDSLARIHDRIDGQYKNCAECGASHARIQATLDEIVRTVNGMCDNDIRTT